MSYCIEYNRQFIRSTDGITPVWLNGDNNVTEFTYGRERRARSWSVFLQVLAVSEAELEAAAQRLMGGPYQEHWMRRGTWIDDKALANWVKSGIKSAATVEQILTANRSMGSIHCYLSIWDKQLNHRVDLPAYVRTTQEFDEWAAAAKPLIQEEKEKRDVCVSCR